jgi:hypothetical protein
MNRAVSQGGKRSFALNVAARRRAMLSRRPRGPRIVLAHQGK